MRERVVRAIGAEKKHIGLYLQALVKWLLLAAVTGGICGAVGAAFHIGIHEAELLRGRFPDVYKRQHQLRHRRDEAGVRALRPAAGGRCGEQAALFR